MSNGTGQSGEGPGGRAVDRFYRVAFADERDFRDWTERILEFRSAVAKFIPIQPEMRPVIFVPTWPAPGVRRYAYVSAGARGLGLHISGGAKLDPAPLNIDELPRGLTLLWGEAVDAAEYEERHL